MSSARRNARNLAINGSSFAATGLVTFLLSPFVIHSLGPVEYGIWSLLNVLTGYMGVLDLGVRASTVRHIILYIGRGDDNAVDATVRTSLSVYSMLGLLILGVAGLLGWVFPQAFGAVPPEYRTKLLWLVPLMAVNVWTSAIAAVFSGILLAHERFDLSRGIDILNLLVRTVGTVIVLTRGSGIVGLAFVVVASNFLPLAANFWFSKRLFTGLRIWPLRPDQKRLRELGGYGAAAFVSTVAIRIIAHTDLVIVGSVIDVASVTVYSVGAILVYYSAGILRQVASTFQPGVQKAVARDEMGSARWTFYRQVRLSNLIGIPVYTGFIIYSEPFIRLWMLGPGFGEDSVLAAAMVMRILAAAKLLNLFYAGTANLLAATGHVRLTAALSICEAILNLGLSIAFVLALDMGLAGVALGTFVSRLAVKTFWLPLHASRKTGLNFQSYLLQIGARGVVSIGLFACWCQIAITLVPCQTWASFFFSVTLSLAGFFPIAILLLIPESDRQRVRDRLRTFAHQA